MEDLDSVLAAEQECTTAPHWSLEAYQNIFREGDGIARCLFVAEMSGVVVGYSVGSLVEGEGELEAVAVKEEARRRGLGRLLVVAVLQWCGNAAVRLEVRHGSEEAIQLYKACGFQAAGVRRGYYSGPKEDALLMVREGCSHHADV